MPRWLVKCPNCGHAFTHTKIELAVVEESHRDPYGILSKPEIPQGGEKRSCPNCETESVFKPFQLFYRDDSFEASG
jgi:endogenous inhibitor of DNA gyrase (YacG/DUF329 family)